MSVAHMLETCHWKRNRKCKAKGREGAEGKGFKKVEKGWGEGWRSREKGRRGRNRWKGFSDESRC